MKAVLFLYVIYNLPVTVPMESTASLNDETASIIRHAKTRSLVVASSISKAVIFRSFDQNVKTA